jgi:predicted metal-binding membrane protein
VRTEIDAGLSSPRTRESAERSFLAASALVFLAGAYITIRSCDETCCGVVPMRGGWTLCTAWTRSAGESWLGAALSFLAMWTVMMIAMMTPCLVPMLREYRRTLHASERWSSAMPVARLHGLTAIASAGYFSVWTLLGAAIYPIGVAMARVALRSPLVSSSAPLAFAIVLAISGVVQLTPWKSRRLLECRAARCCANVAIDDVRSAWRHGLELGVHCVQCCSGFMLMLLVLGAMNLWAMALIAAAMLAERIAPNPERMARTTGALAIVAGAIAGARALIAG